MTSKLLTGKLWAISPLYKAYYSVIYLHDAVVFVSLLRAYRIGQCRDVTVLRLISLGTVEEVIYLRQVYKQVPSHYKHAHTHTDEMITKLITVPVSL